MGKQAVLPIRKLELPEDKELGWKPFFDSSGIRFLGIENPRFGRIELSGVVELDEDGEVEKYLYDIPQIYDGPYDSEAEHSTPGALIVPVEEAEDGYYLHCHEEFRPVIYDHVEGVKGVTVISFAGGFAKLGEDPQDAALREVLDEEGVEVEEASMVRAGYASSNRAFAETCPEVYIARFKRKGAATPDDEEAILGNKVIRIDNFPVGMDALVNSAYAMVVQHLQTVAPMSVYTSAFPGLENLRKGWDQLNAWLAKDKESAA